MKCMEEGLHVHNRYIVYHDLLCPQSFNNKNEQWTSYNKKIHPKHLLFFYVHTLNCSVKKAFRYFRHQPGCHLPNSPWAGIMTSYIQYIIPAYRESLVSDIPAGDGNIEKNFYGVQFKTRNSYYNHYSCILRCMSTSNKQTHYFTCFFCAA